MTDQSVRVMVPPLATDSLSVWFEAMEIVDPPKNDRPLCPHAPIPAATPRANECEECGSSINLRACASCGHVGCCESQAGHARTHALADRHPVIEQITGGGLGFAWCYEESRYVR